jgi:hypothetical protein
MQPMLAFSEKDGTRLVEPDDTIAPVLNGVLWDPFKLGEIFDARSFGSARES